MRMSVYNFNQHEHVSANHVSSNYTRNGTQARYQVDSDYLNRGFSSSNHHSDMSVQLTRPTSKTAMLVRQRRAMLEQLSCYLCKGYLIDATTIDECMDSFCKSCIVIYLRNHNNCPKCGTLIHKTNPLSNIRSDKVLQDIVYKLVPGLYDDEMKRRREFYRGMFGTSSSEDDEDGSSGSFAGRCSKLSSEQHGVVSHPKPFYKPTDNIDLSIEPQTRGDDSAIYYDNKIQSIVTCFTGNLQQQQQQQPPKGSMFSAVDSQQFKTYLRCPAKLTALQLKKFIAAKFNICKDDTIHLLYLNESLKDEYSLIDIAYIYDWRGIEHMRLFYIIERDLSKTNNNLRDCQLEGNQLRKSKHRQSVATSTQTVKRVCIDPHPKFYEEQNNNVINNKSGRNMRSRNEQLSSSSKGITSYVTQTPILRSYSSSSRDSNSGADSSQSNGASGVASRELIALGCQDTTRSPFTSSVTSAIDELSRLKQDNPKDTRSSRKLAAESAVGSIPKININLNSLNRTNDLGERGINTYSKLKNDVQKKEVVAQHNNIRQLVPYVRQGYSTGPIAAGPSQSSIVTLASFTEARSNHVVAMSASSAATITSSYKNILGSGTSSKLEVKSDSKSNHQITKTPQATPQLAFSFVTERGITIVRRLNSQDETSASTSSSAINRANSINALSAPMSQSITMGADRQSSTSHYSHTTNQSLAGFSGGTQTNISHSTGQDGNTPRHHMKVKPVYKTFVDPTKLKSPNFKKLGYTARH